MTQLLHASILPIDDDPLARLSARARRFASAPPGLLIDGRFVQPIEPEPWDLVDPGTGRAFATYDLAGVADARLAVEAAARAFEAGSPWRRMPATGRSLLMNRLADLMDENRAELAELESLDAGKPIGDAAGFDVEYAIRHVRYFAGWPTKIEGNTIPVGVPEMLVRTDRVPVGVVSQIIPWNYPLLMAAWKLSPALAAGCTVVLKPAEQTVLTALRLAELVVEAGFPPGVVNVLPARGATVGDLLVEHPAVHKIAFTGSTVVGQQIARRAADGVKRLTLELGGKSANIVCADADLAAAAPGAAAAIFANAGQVCSAGSRLFVQRTVLDDFMAALEEAGRAYTMTHQLDSRCRLGPLVSDVQLGRVRDHLERAAAEGGRFAFGGGVQPAGLGSGYYVEPTAVLADDDASITREEVFGPVVVVLPFDSEDEVVARANSSRYGLAAGVWSRDIGTANRIAGALRAGTVFVNTYGQSDAAAPFGGFGHSGYGREMGHANLEAYLETRTVWTNLA